LKISIRQISNILLTLCREQQNKFLPLHVSRSTWSWLRISGKNSPEVRLLEEFKRIPTSMPVRKLVRRYLECCWRLPYYGWVEFLHIWGPDYYLI